MNLHHLRLSIININHLIGIDCHQLSISSIGYPTKEKIIIIKLSSFIDFINWILHERRIVKGWLQKKDHLQKPPREAL